MPASSCAGSSCTSCRPASIASATSASSPMATAQPDSRLVASCWPSRSRIGRAERDAEPDDHPCAPPCQHKPEPDVCPCCGSRLADPVDAAPRAAPSCAGPPMMIEASIISGMLTAPALAARARKVTRPVRPARSSTVDHGPLDHVGRSPHADPSPDATGSAAPRERSGHVRSPTAIAVAANARDTPPIARDPPRLRSIRLP